MFDILSKEDLFVKLVDRDGDSISLQDLPKLLWQFKADSSFYVEMVFTNGVITSLNAQVFFNLLKLVIPNLFIYDSKL